MKLLPALVASLPNIGFRIPSKELKPVLLPPPLSPANSGFRIPSKELKLVLALNYTQRRLLSFRIPSKELKPSSFSWCSFIPNGF